MPQKRMECFRLLLEHLAWIEHQILSVIRDSRKAGSLWGIMRGEGGVRKPIHQSGLAKRLGLGLLCWGFKGVQEEIPREEASSLQTGSVAFPLGTSFRYVKCQGPRSNPASEVLVSVQSVWFSVPQKFYNFGGSLSSIFFDIPSSASSLFNVYTKNPKILFDRILEMFLRFTSLTYMYIFFLIYIYISPVGWDFRIYQLHLCRGVRHLRQRLSWYDI